MSDEGDKGGFEIVSGSTAETIEIGRKVGAALKGGEVIALVGPLGSGKTHLIKGIAAGAGATDSGCVNSPTFVIVNEYLSEGDGLDVYHIDAYRIESDGEFDMLGFDDFCYRRSVVVIEWADKVEGALKGVECIRIEMSHVDEERRGICLRNAPGYVLSVLG
jgi:tRNA threonylcarbamoyladenosine biosynthesis protein TsaE